MTKPDADTVLTVRRRFAVWLEDAFEVAPPSSADLAEHDSDLTQWAQASMNAIYQRANDPEDAGVTLLWEDQHKLDLDFPEEEVTVDAPEPGIAPPPTA